jgi:hypothetical protein
MGELSNAGDWEQAGEDEYGEELDNVKLFVRV